MKKIKYWDEITKENLQEIVKVSFAYTHVMKKLNISVTGNAFKKIKELINRYEIDISHFTGPLWNKGKTLLDDNRLSKHSIENIFSINSSVSSHCVRSLIKKKSLIPYSCNKCQNSGEWMNEKLHLQLDHINGNRKDQRLENLRWMCPNCHSQTETFCSRNSKKKIPITDQQIIDALKQTENVSSALKLLGIYTGGNYYRVYKLAHKILNDDNSFIMKERIEEKNEDMKNEMINRDGRNKYRTREEYELAKRKVKNRPNKEELLKIIWEIPSTEVGKSFNVSGNAIKKWAQSYGIPHPPVGYWAKYKAGHIEECKQIKDNLFNKMVAPEELESSIPVKESSS